MFMFLVNDTSKTDKTNNESLGQKVNDNTYIWLYCMIIQ